MTPEQCQSVLKKTGTGTMVPFIIWSQGKLREFRRLRPDCFMMGGSGYSLCDHKAYDAWLEETVKPPKARKA